MTLRAEANEFGLIIQSAAFNSSGDTITPGNDTYGSFVQLLDGTDTAQDSYEIEICCNSNAVSGSARDLLLKIALDPAGGTSFTQTLITDLSGSCAGFTAATNSGNGGIWYRFPLFIKAGTAVGVAASVHNATVGTCAVFCKLKCQPSRPDLIRAGSFVRTFGSTPASSTGTAITPSTGSKSSYVQLGSSVADNLWWWCLGIGCNNNAMNDNLGWWDLAIGDGTNKRIVIPDLEVMPSSLETLAFRSFGAPAQATNGDNVYVRAGSRSASPSGMSAIAYAVGG